MQSEPERYTRKPREFEPAIGSEPTLETIGAWAQRHAGGVQSVLHEVISDLVHLDVHVCPHDPQGCVTLVTSGMSDRPMPGAEKFGVPPYAELIMRLPRDWALPPARESITEWWTRDAWPIGLLKWLARFPHVYESALGFGHTLALADPPAPLHESVRFVGVILLPPVRLGEDSYVVRASDGRQIHLYSVIPLLADEMDFKVKRGLDALLKRFDSARAIDVLNVDRQSVVRGRRRFGS